MTFTFNDNYGRSFIPANPRSYNEKSILNINWAFEGTVALGILLISIGLYILECFIRNYAYSLLYRRNELRQLKVQNANLAKELKQLSITCRFIIFLI